MSLSGKAGFTLIELIIVVVIVGILAMVAIPRYFVNIKKARKAKVVSNLGAIRDAIIGYTAANNVAPSVTAPTTITVSIDGETILTQSVPANYTFVTDTLGAATTEADGCAYTMALATAAVGIVTAGCP